MKIVLEKVAVPIIVAAGCALALLALRAVSFRVLHRWAGRTRTGVDNIIVDSLKTPALFWCLAIAIYVAIALSELPAKYVSFSSKAMDIIIILAITVAAANLGGRVLRHYVQVSDFPIPTTGLAYGIVKGAILMVGILVILTVLNVSITPLITTLGVGGLAVALALQDSLANLFAGIHILMEKSIRIGDFVKLETGQEGYVEDITWRTTRVRMLPNNMVIVPNSALAKSIVTNYYLPEKKMSLLIPISVSYDSDPDRVEKLLVDEATNSVGSIPGLRDDPVPFVRFIPGFGASSLDFTLICQVEEFTDQYLAQHELRKRILGRFRQEGIEIPYPHRTVYLREAKGWTR